jgi:hypothetical protein
MAEWIPIILSFCIGTYLRLGRRRSGSIALASVGIVLIGAGAFVVSGEFRISWTYLFADIVQTSFGFFASNAAPLAVRHVRNLGKAN